jgi:hypothetical protein
MRPFAIAAVVVSFALSTHGLLRWSRWWWHRNGNGHGCKRGRWNEHGRHHGRRRLHV